MTSYKVSMTQSNTGLLSREEYEIVTQLKKVKEFQRIAQNVANNKFEEGDYVNCFNILTNKYLPISWRSNHPAIYRVVCVNEFGLVFTKKVCLSGELSKNIECISLAGPGWEYRLDPRYADFLILRDEGDQFDPLEIIRELREYKR